MQPAEACRHLDGAEGAQAPVIDQDDQADVSGGVFGLGAHRHGIEDHPVFALEIDSVLGRGKDSRRRGRQEAVGHPLVHQGAFVQANFRLSPGFLDQQGVGFKGRSVEPLPRTRQGSEHRVSGKRLRIGGFTGIQPVILRLPERCVLGPCFKGLLQCLGIFGRHCALPVARGDMKPSIRCAIGEGYEFHRSVLLASSTGVSTSGLVQSLIRATGRHQPALAPLTLTGKQMTSKPLAGSVSSAAIFSMWQ